MINLIPPAGYTVLKREYLLRVGASLGFLLGSVFCVLTAALVPTYILTSAQIADYTTLISNFGDEAQTFAEAERVAGEAQVLLAQMQKGTQTPRASALIQALVQRAPEGIIFKTFALQAAAGVPHIVQVQGVAATREVLIRFKNEIEAASEFEKAEVPIADLARDADLPFAITITLATTP